jgi:hypothetical protein
MIQQAADTPFRCILFLSSACETRRSGLRRTIATMRFSLLRKFVRVDDVEIKDWELAKRFRLYASAASP